MWWSCSHSVNMYRQLFCTSHTSMYKLLSTHTHPLSSILCPIVLFSTIFYHVYVISALFSTPTLFYSTLVKSDPYPPTSIRSLSTLLYISCIVCNTCKRKGSSNTKPPWPALGKLTISTFDFLPCS